MVPRSHRLLDSALGALVLAALFATPLVRTTAFYDQFLLPKTALVSLLAVLILALQGVRSLAGAEVRLDLHGVNRWLLAFWLWNAALAPFASSPSLAWDRVVWLLAIGVVCWGWQQWAGGNRRRLLVAAWALVLAAGVTACWALADDLAARWRALLPAWLLPSSTPVNRLGDWRGLISAGFGNTDFIAMFLALAAPPAALLLLRVRSRLSAAALWLLVLSASAALIACWSVGNNASLILAALVTALALGRAGWRPLWRRRRARLLAGAAAGLLAVLWLVPDTPFNPHRAPAGSPLPGIFHEAFASQRWKEGGPTRGVIWLNALEMIRTHQLRGVGPGCFSYAYPAVRSPFLPRDPAWLRYQGRYTNAAHNTLLQTWAELGPVGVFLLVGMVWAAFRALGLRLRESRGTDGRIARLEGWIALGNIGALTVLCGASLMSFPLVLPASAVLFFALLPTGEMLGDATRDAEGFRMPPLVFEGRWSEWVLHLRGMKQVVSVGWRARTGRTAAVAGVLLAVLLAAAAAARIGGPLLSDREYLLAREAQPTAAAEPHYRRALAWNPRNHDCRSAFAAYLLARGRFQECLDQLEQVFKRLDSPELYLRRAAALESLGRTEEAVRDLDVYRQRVPTADGAEIPGQPGK